MGMRVSKKVSSVLVAATLAAFSVAYIASADSMADATLHTASGAHPLSIEIAATPEERSTGLMNRESLPADQGMLFVYDRAQPISMWMKNTLIPLDMLFLDSQGRVSHIATNAEPLSLDTISSGGPARYVLELNGGAASRLDVERGDRLEADAIDEAGDEN